MDIPKPLVPIFVVQNLNLAHPLCLDDSIKWALNCNSYSYFIVKHEGEDRAVKKSPGMEKFKVPLWSYLANRI